MKEFFIYLYISILGGFGYCTIEIISRGRTHYSMFFAGAIILACFYYISFNINLPYLFKCVIGALLITLVELVFGICFNILLGQNVWDYSTTPFNFMGQICLPYSALWLLTSGIVFALLKRTPKIV